jgi:hypothetical protein
MKKILLGCVALLFAAAPAYGQSYIDELAKQLPAPFRPGINKMFLEKEWRGGNLEQHKEYFKALAASGEDVEVRDACWSACTLVLAYIPKKQLCFSQTATLGFHLARLPNGKPAMIASWAMFNSYPQDIRMWLQAKGGVENMPLDSFWLLFPSELWQMGYRQCDWLGTVPHAEIPDVETQMSGRIWRKSP